jgi:plasmid stability protein
VATLHVRNIPDELYEGLRRLADDQGRSISEQVIEILRTMLRHDRQQARKLMAELVRERPRLRPGAPAAADLIRQDRDSR